MTNYVGIVERKMLLLCTVITKSVIISPARYRGTIALIYVTIATRSLDG